MNKLDYALKTYRRLLKATQKYWFLFVLGILGTIILSLIDAAFTWMVKPLINEGFVHRNIFFIKILPFMLVIIFIFRGIAGFASNYCISRVARNVVRDFRRQIFSKLLKLPASFYDRNSSGYLLSTIVYNVEQVAQASSDSLIMCLRESSLLIGLLIVMFAVSWRLSSIFLVITPFVAWIVKWSSARMRRLSKVVQQSVGDVTHLADEGIQAYKVIRLFGGQEHEYQKFCQATKKNQQRELKIVVTKSIGTAVVQLLIVIPTAAALLCALLPSMKVTAGGFGAVITSMIMLTRPVRRLTNVNSDIQKGVAGAESIFTVLDEQAEKDEGGIHVERAKGKIDYKNVEFSYSESKKPVLKNVNVSIYPGQIVAIVGRSGSGKSTLINLLPRFYQPQVGEITIDGININDYSLESLRNQFAFVSQQPVLFNDTIANNIAYGMKEKVSREDVVKVADAAYVTEFINALPDSLDTIIGEDGVLLSGGQRQRIAIARALLKNAPILVLDEATSALDTYSERQIQNALEQLMQQRTTLVIAHRLSTIENADWIIVLEDGKVVEQGTHKELLENNGAYTALHRLQFKEPKTPNLAAKEEALVEYE